MSISFQCYNIWFIFPATNRLFTHKLPPRRLSGIFTYNYMQKKHCLFRQRLLNVVSGNHFTGPFAWRLRPLADLLRYHYMYFLLLYILFKEMSIIFLVTD